MTNSKTLIISLITFTLVSFTILKNSFAENETSNFSNYDFIGKVKVVDGEMFSWYGSRLQHAANYFQNLLKSIP